MPTMPHIEDAWVIQCGPEVGPCDEGLYHRRGAEGDANGYTSDLMSAGVWCETDARRIAGQRDVVVPLLDLLWKTDRNSVGGLLTLRALVNARDGDAWGEASKRVPWPADGHEVWRAQAVGGAS